MDKKMLKIGSRVVYAHNDTTERQKSGYFPPIGTRGTIIDSFLTGFVSVRWDSGTCGDGEWYCDKDDLEVVG